MLAFGQVLYIKPLRIQLPVARALSVPAIGAHLGHHAAATDLAVARYVKASCGRGVQREDLFDRFAGIRMEDRLVPRKDGCSQFGCWLG